MSAPGAGRVRSRRVPLRDRLARRLYALAERVGTPCEHDWMEFANHDECFLCGRHQPAERGNDD